MREPPSIEVLALAAVLGQAARTTHRPGGRRRSRSADRRLPLGGFVIGTSVLVGRYDCSAYCASARGRRPAVPADDTERERGR